MNVILFFQTMKRPTDNILNRILSTSIVNLQIFILTQLILKQVHGALFQAPSLYIEEIFATHSCYKVLCLIFAGAKFNPFTAKTKNFPNLLKYKIK